MMRVWHSENTLYLKQIGLSNCSKLSSHKFWSKLPLAPASPGALKVISLQFLSANRQEMHEQIWICITPFEDPAFFSKRGHIQINIRTIHGHIPSIYNGPATNGGQWCHCALGVFPTTPAFILLISKKPLPSSLIMDILGVRREIQFSNTSLDHGDVKTYTAHVRLDLWLIECRNICIMCNPMFYMIW